MKLIYLIFLVFCFPVFVAAQSLKIDHAFGTNGATSANTFMDGFNDVYCSAMQADGKLLIGSKSLTRVLPGGGIDSSFGFNGSVLTKNISAIAVFPDGKIVCIVGNGYNNVFCVRLDASGKIDSSFNQTGYQEVFLPAYFVVKSINIQSDNKMVLCGDASEINPGPRFAVKRLNYNGSTDSSFNSVGYVMFSLPDTTASLSSAAVRPDGKILITGYSNVNQFSSTRLLTVYCILPDGGIDNNFGDSGHIVYRDTLPVAQYSVGSAIKVLANNSFFIGGLNRSRLLLAKFDANGHPDSTFSNAGVYLDSTGSFQIVSAVDITVDHKILVMGSTVSSSTGYDFSALQLTADGQPDLNFGNNGTVLIAKPTSDISVNGFLQPGGNFFITGASNNFSSNAIGIARFSSNGNSDTNFGTSGMQYLFVKGADDICKAFAVLPGGGFVAAADILNSSSAISMSIALVKFNADGKIDSSFGNHGKAYVRGENSKVEKLLLLADGKLLLMGINFIPYNFGGQPTYEYSKMYIWRINQNGTVDSSFAVNGRFKLDNLSRSYEGGDIAVQPDGKIVIGANALAYAKAFLTRLHADGSIDSSFGTSGEQILASDSIIIFNKLKLTYDNKIMIGGIRNVAYNPREIFIKRLLSDGTADTSFANGAFSTNLRFNANVNLNAIMTQEDGKIIACGNTESSLLVERLTNTGAFDTSLNAVGYTLYPQRQFDGAVYYPEFEWMPDSSIYVAGFLLYSLARVEPFVLHIKSNGSLDSTISADGTPWLNQFPAGQYTSDAIAIRPDKSILIGGRSLVGNSIDIRVTAFKQNSDDAILYTFTGNGNWSDPSKWSFSRVPPSVLPDGNIIVINSGQGNTCTLDVDQRIAPGAVLHINQQSQLDIPGSLFIQK